MGVVGWGVLFCYVPFVVEYVRHTLHGPLLSAVFVSWLCLFLPSAKIVPYEGAWHLTASIHLFGGQRVGCEG
jgi:hypothetical protein